MKTAYNLKYNLPDFLLQTLNLLSGHIYIKDKDSRVLWSSQEQVKMLGYESVEEIIGKSMHDLYSKEDADLIRQNDLKVIESGESLFTEENVVVDGKHRVMLCHKSPYKDEYGNIMGIIGYALNITEQKNRFNQLDEKYQQNLVTLDSIVANMPGYVYWKDKDGVILGCNIKQAENLGADDPKKVVGRTVFNFLNKDAAHEIHINDMRIMQTDSSEIIEETSTINGKKFVTISHKAPLKDTRSGKILGTIGVSVDITKQKEAEEAYQERTKELIKAIEVKDTFLSNMSHEIRTPLQGIFGLLELLEDEEIWNKTPDSEKRRMFKNVLDSRDRFMNLLSNLLDLSDLRKGREPLQLGYHDMKSLISNTAQEFQNCTESITMDVPANVNTYISCDDWRISQVLHNVIANCIKHGGQDKPIHIALDTLKEKDKKTYLRIAIQDEGVGIPEDQLEEIFDPFTESNRTRRISGGTGIGLALCKDIIAAHRGKIWAENNASGVGSTFFIALPYGDHPKKIYSYRLTQRS